MSAPPVSNSLRVWQQSTAKVRYTTELDQVDVLRPEVNKLVASLWNTIEFNLSEIGLDGPTLRRRAREWSVTYLTRPDETPDPEPTPDYPTHPNPRHVKKSPHALTLTTMNPRLDEILPPTSR